MFPQIEVSSTPNFLSTYIYTKRADLGLCSNCNLKWGFVVDVSFPKFSISFLTLPFILMTEVTEDFFFFLGGGGRDSKFFRYLKISPNLPD